MINDPDAWKSRDFEAAGFSQRHTGGGCVAWELELEEADVWVTDEDGVSLPDQESTWILVGFTKHNKSEVSKIAELDELSEHLFVIEGFFSYGFSLEKTPLDQILPIIKAIPRDTFIKEVVLGQNNPDKEENQ